MLKLRKIMNLNKVKLIIFRQHYFIKHTKPNA